VTSTKGACLLLLEGAAFPEKIKNKSTIN